MRWAAADNNMCVSIRTVSDLIGEMCLVLTWTVEKRVHARELQAMVLREK